MSEVAETQSKLTTKRDDQADKQVFAQVEKWMAMIRELNHDHEQQAPTEPAG
jgi:hypothetical protein